MQLWLAMSPGLWSKQPLPLPIRESAVRIAAGLIIGTRIKETVIVFPCFPQPLPNPRGYRVQSRQDAADTRKRRRR